MTNFRIGFPHIPFDASSVTPSMAAATGFEAANLITGSRGDSFHLAAASASDLTLSFPVTLGHTADYLYLAHADWLKGYNVSTVALEAGGVTVYSNADFANVTLVGPRHEDFIAAFAASAAATDWVLRLQASAATLYPFSKAYFGRFFDFGREPIKPIELSRKRNGDVSRDARYTFSLTWQDISDAKVCELFSSVLRWADVSPVVLYDADNAVLPGCTVIHAKIVSHERTTVALNSNDVTIDFRELI